MPVDMMVEAMKVIYTKSVSGHSKSSLFRKSSLSKGSQYGFFGSPSNSSRSEGSPSLRSNSSPSLHGVTSSHQQDIDFTTSFVVKFYGSSTVRHYSDFGGCQMVMDRLLLKNRSLTSSIIQLASSKKAPRSSNCILVFTSHEMQMFSNDNQVCMEKIPLDCVYAVHPHPIKDKYFGILADHPPSGTVHCYCYSTKQPTTSIDVLCGFREACMYWLEKNLSHTGADVAAKEASFSNEKKKEKATRSFSSLSEANRDSSRKLSGRWHLEYEALGCGSDEAIVGKSSLRRVSFAPCDRLVDDEESLAAAVTDMEGKSTSKDDDTIEVEDDVSVHDDAQETSSLVSEEEQECVTEAMQRHSEELEEGEQEKEREEEKENEEEEDVENQSSSDSDDTDSENSDTDTATKNSEKPLYYLNPKLPQRNFLPPSPPPNLSHYQRPVSSHRPQGLLSRKTQSEEDYLSYHIKKKLLALKLKEKAAKQQSRTRLLGVSSQNSSSSNGDSRRRLDKGSPQPLFNSNVDSDLTDESNPTIYYTPKQSLEFQERKTSRDFTDEEMPTISSHLICDNTEDVDESKSDLKQDKGCDPEKIQGHDSLHAQNSNSSRCNTFGIPSGFNRRKSNDSQTSKNSGDESRVSDTSSNDNSVGSNSTHSSACTSTSAPSFLISSSTQLCQCIGGSNVSNEKFKALLDRICDGVGKKASQQEELASPSEKIQISSPSQNGTFEVFEETENTQEGKRLCQVDESWWQKIEASCSGADDPVDDLDVIEEQQSPDILSDFDKSMDSPVVKYRKIELDDLLHRLYPTSGSISPNTCKTSEDAPDEEIAPIESEIIPDDFSIKGGELGDLVELLEDVSEPSSSNLTNYEPAEMSLDICSGDMEQIGSAVECLLPPPLLPTPQPKVDHVSIEIPDDVTFSGNTEGSPADQTTKCFGQNCFAPLSSILCSNLLDELNFEQKSGEPSKSNPLQPGLSTNLIDIDYESEKEPLSSTPKRKLQNDLQTSSLIEISPGTSSDWQDLSLCFSQNWGICNSGCLKPSLPDTPKCTDTDFDSSVLSTAQKRLSVNLKQLDKDTLELLEFSNQDDESYAPDGKNSSFVMDSLCSATGILEQSHDCLAKSVHSLCQRAIVKQSNISLELVLPSDRASKSEYPEEKGCFNGLSAVLEQPKQSVLNVELNSSVTYPHSKRAKVNSKQD